MIRSVDVDLRFDGRPGRGTIRASGGRLVVEPEGWRSALGLTLWALRRGTDRALIRKFASAVGLPLYLKLPGLPRLRLVSATSGQS